MVFSRKETLKHSQTWLHIFWETLFCIMKISQRAFLTRSHFSNQSSLKSPLEHETRNTWKFQLFSKPHHALWLPCIFVDHTQTATAHISSSLPQNYCCVWIKRSRWAEVIKSICSLVLLARRRLKVSRLAKLPNTFQSHTGPLFSLLGAQRGDGKGGRELHITLEALRELEGNMQFELARYLSTELLWLIGWNSLLW